MGDSGATKHDLVEQANELCRFMIGYQSGEMSAFEALYSRLAPHLRGYLTALTWNRARAEDLLQETFLQFHRARHTYIPPRPVRPWAFAIARHCYLMDLRVFARKRSREMSMENGIVDIPTPPEMDGFAEMDSVRQALRDIPLDRREAVLLHYVWGFSYSEIGKMLGIGAGAAKVRAFRGIESLRALLETNEGLLHVGYDE
jgi:RNA polymerase sigma-70 factor (ECF subfamily)